MQRGFEYISPILTIQIHVKRFLAVTLYKKKRKLVPKMMRCLKWMFKRCRLNKWVTQIGLTRESLKLIGRARFLQRIFREILEKERILGIYVTKITS